MIADTKKKHSALSTATFQTRNSTLMGDLIGFELVKAAAEAKLRIYLATKPSSRYWLVPNHCLVPCDGWPAFTMCGVQVSARMIE